MKHCKPRITFLFSISDSASCGCGWRTTDGFNNDIKNDITFRAEMLEKLQEINLLVLNVVKLA